MGKYMYTIKKMLSLIDEFDKEDVNDTDKIMVLDRKLRELHNQAKCVYTDTILQHYDQILELLQETEEQNVPMFVEKFNISNFLYSDESEGEVVEYPFVEDDILVFNLNLTVDRGFTNPKSKSLYWGIDYDVHMEDDIHDESPLTEDSYYIKSISRNASISEKSCFRDIDSILDILKESHNLIKLIKTRFMVKPEEYDDSVLNILSVRIYYLLHMIVSLVIYGATTEANKMVYLPIEEIEAKYIKSKVV